MSLLHKNGKVHWLNADGIGTDYTITGLGFRPRAIRVWTFGHHTTVDAITSAQNNNSIVGFCTETLLQYSVSAFDRDNVGTTECGCMVRSDCIACTTNNTGAAGGKLRVHEINSDGFVLRIDATTLSADLTLFWDVWGGNDIRDVIVGNFTSPASTGNVDYAATGVVYGDANQVLMLAGCQGTNLDSGTNTDAGFWTGFANLAGQCVICSNSDDAVVSSTDTDNYAQGGECIAQIPVTGGANTVSRASFVQWNTDGFRLNWFEAGTSGQQNIFMVIRGGGWVAGDGKINSNAVSNTTTVRGLPFTPIGGLLLRSIGSEHAPGATNSIGMLCAGSFSGLTSRQSSSLRAPDATTPSSIIMANEYDQVLIKVTNVPDLESALDIDDLSAGSFRLIVDVSIGVGDTDWFGYLVFGDQPNPSRLLGQVWA